MFSMSSARAPSPASAVATSPDARNSRKASAETAIATSTASPRRFSAKASMKDPSSPQYHVPGSRLSRPRQKARGCLAGMIASRSFPAHLPEARHLVRIGGEHQILGGDIVGRDQIERQHVGALRDQSQR